MRVIPVIDLQAGRVVHAVRGERNRYQPLQSVICGSAEPLDVARTFRDTFGLSEFYIADLDAIQRCGDHKNVIAQLTSQEGLEILLDAGSAEMESIRPWYELGVSRVIVGSETLPDLHLLDMLPVSDLGGHLIFSLDMRSGQILSACAELARMTPVQAIERLASAGWQEVILLDLARVGTGAGIDWGLISAVRQSAPQLSAIIGGGIHCAEELFELKAAGISAALAATALHNGAITRDQIAGLDRSGG